MSTIEFCRICKSDKFIDVLNLGYQGLASRFPASGEEDPPKIPLIIVKCENPDC